MKIIFLGTRGFPDVQGGVEKHCENLAVNLVNLGCQVTVYTRRPYVNREIREYKGVKLIDLPAFRQKSLEALLHTFYGILRAFKDKPDILHIHGIGPGLFIPAAKLLGMKVVLTTHGSNYKHNKWNKLEKHFLRLCEFISIKFADGIIAISDIISGEIKEKYGRNSFVIPNGIQTFERDKTCKVLEYFKLDPGKYVLAVGRIVPEKGFHDLIKAFKSIDLKDWKLVLAGGIDHTSKYSKSLLESSKDDSQIVFTGVMSGKPLYELYENAGIFVLPSYYEGMPIVLLEAMSFGLYCLVSDIPANLAIGLPGENYFKVGDSRDLTEKLAGIIRRNENLRLSRELIDRLLHSYDWGIITEKTLGVYESVLNIK